MELVPWALKHDLSANTAKHAEDLKAVAAPASKGLELALAAAEVPDARNVSPNIVAPEPEPTLSQSPSQPRVDVAARTQVSPATVPVAPVVTKPVAKPASSTTSIAADATPSRLIRTRRSQFAERIASLTVDVYFKRSADVLVVLDRPALDRELLNKVLDSTGLTEASMGLLDSRGVSVSDSPYRKALLLIHPDQYPPEALHHLRSMSVDAGQGQWMVSFHTDYMAAHRSEVRPYLWQDLQMFKAL